MKRRINSCIVAAVLGGVFFTFYYIFARYGAGHHDFRAHAAFANELTRLASESLQSFLETTKNSHILAYPGWHICYLATASIISGMSSIIGAVISNQNIYALSVASVNTVILLCTFFLTRKIFERRIPLKNYWRRTILSVVLLFVGPLYIPGLFDSYYLGLKTGNIWHNPTYLIVRPMAVLIFFLYIDIFEDYRQGKRNTENKKLILAGIFLCVSAVLKPSFFQMFLPALFVYCLVELIQKKGKNFGFLIKIGLSVVPVTLIGIFQITILGGSSGGGSGIGVEFLRVWGVRTNYWYIALPLSLAFPIFIFIVKRKEIFHRYTGRLGLASLLSGLLQYMFLYVTKAPKAGDFGWGLALSIFLVFFISMIELERWRQKSGFTSKTIKCAYILLGLHFFLGIFYFYDIFKYLRYTLPLQF